jgi:riboflavin kinase/FMN adenylyltransferase
MRLYRDYGLPSDAKGAVLAIGNFDGVHRGHAQVIAQTLAKARSLDVPAAILTFEPHPRRFFSDDKTRKRLIPFHHKARLLEHLGVDILIAQRFNASFAALEAEAFIDRVLRQGISASHVVTGEEFVFGRGRRGHASMLSDASQKGWFGYDALTPLKTGAEKCSSTHIRDHIVRGEMDIAAGLLGHPYHWLGRVIKGDARGRQIGFPTLNILPPQVLLPRLGVYAVRVSRLGEAMTYHGVANLGNRPTFNGLTLQLEIHVFDQEIDWYDERICVEFHAHLRDEKRFDGVESLRTKIQQDCMQAKNLLAAIPAALPWHAAAIS